MLCDLFSLRVGLVLYDITSTYFEGGSPPEKAAMAKAVTTSHANSQVLVDLVLMDGWPIARHVFQGNWRDANTVPEVLRDLEEHFGLKRVVFVGDRGMVTGHNLDLMRGRGHGYIVGSNRRRSGAVFGYVQSAIGPWIECPVSITAREKATPPKRWSRRSPQQARCAGLRCQFRRTPGFERAQRSKALDRVRIRLEKLQHRVTKGRLKAPEKIRAAAAHILGHNHGHRYYDWRYENDAFRFLRASRPLHSRTGSSRLGSRPYPSTRALAVPSLVARGTHFLGSAAIWTHSFVSGESGYLGSHLQISTCR